MFFHPEGGTLRHHSIGYQVAEKAEDEAEPSAYRAHNTMFGLYFSSSAFPLNLFTATLIVRYVHAPGKRLSLPLRSVSLMLAVFIYSRFLASVRVPQSVGGHWGMHIPLTLSRILL